MSYGTDFEREKGDKANVISLFGQHGQGLLDGGLLPNTVDESFEVEESPLELAMQTTARKLVGDHQFPDQSIYTLQEQLQNLKVGLQRLKFYLDDLDDVIPR